IEDKRIWIYTIRDVRPGEELAYDYQLELETRHTPDASVTHHWSWPASFSTSTKLTEHVGVQLSVGMVPALTVAETAVVVSQFAGPVALSAPQAISATTVKTSVMRMRLASA